MGAFGKMRISTRMHLMLALTLAGLLALCLTALFQLKAGMLEDRKAKIRNLVEYAHTQLAFYDG